MYRPSKSPTSVVWESIICTLDKYYLHYLHYLNIWLALFTLSIEFSSTPFTLFRNLISTTCTVYTTLFNNCSRQRSQWIWANRWSSANLSLLQKSGLQPVRHRSNPSFRWKPEMITGAQSVKSFSSNRFPEFSQEMGCQNWIAEQLEEKETPA